MSIREVWVVQYLAYILGVGLDMWSGSLELHRTRIWKDGCSLLISEAGFS